MTLSPDHMPHDKDRRKACSHEGCRSCHGTRRQAGNTADAVSAGAAIAKTGSIPTTNPAHASKGIDEVTPMPGARTTPAMSHAPKGNPTTKAAACH